MVRIGIVGVGFMGWTHYLAYQRLRGATFAAVCSRDAAKLAGDWTTIKGNFGPPGEQVDLSAIRKSTSYDEMLADSELDLIDVCNPTAQHPDYAIKALQAGKHVLVEKAIALDPKDADAMVAAAAEAGKMLMVAHVLPFFPEFAYAAKVTREGTYGKLLAGHFERIISRPDWSADISDAAKTGGPAVDLHIHDTHFIGLLFGTPKSVFSTGIVENDVVQHLTTAYDFGPGGPAITCTSGAMSMSGRPFVHGYELFFERGTLKYDTDGIPLTLITAGQSEPVVLEGGGDAITAFANELQTAVDGIVAGQLPALLSGQLARDALVMCHREIESVKTGRSVSL